MVTSTDNNTLYLATYCDNLYKISIRNLKTGSVDIVNSRFTHDDIEGLAIDERNPTTLYILCQGQGLVELNTLTSASKTLLHLPENVFSTQLKYYNGYLWITSSHGLYIFDKAKGQYKRYHSDKDDRYSLSDSYTTCVMHSDEGKSLWVGTLGGGICVYNSTFNSFRKFYNPIGGGK